MIAITVSTCRECPFAIADDLPLYCDADQSDHPRAIDRVVTFPDPPPPAWCPLREADRLVTLRVP